MDLIVLFVFSLLKLLLLLIAFFNLFEHLISHTKVDFLIMLQHCLGKRHYSTDGGLAFVESHYGRICHISFCVQFEVY